MSHIRAWLHEIEPTDWGVYSYWITGKDIIRAFYPFTVEFFLTKDDYQTEKQVLSHPQVEKTEKVLRYRSIHDTEPSHVLCIRVNPNQIRGTYEDFRKYWGEHLHNTDLSLWQQFCFQTKLFPYAHARIEVTNGWLKRWALLETYEQMDYQNVPFHTLFLQPIFQEPRFLRGKITKILIRPTIVEQEEGKVVFEDKKEGTLIYNCIQYIQQQDPDILFTRGGDTFFPIISEHAVRTGNGHLCIGRGPRPLSSYVRRHSSDNSGHSYISYGRVYFSQHGVYFDGGRHHYDIGNSFMWKDGDLSGIQELIRLGCSDPQRIARGTIGTALTAVQMRTAYLRDILIPARKADAESFRPAWSLQSDVGGLVFCPRVGFHANVTELDFLSMYPNIMVHLNVSPETVNCTCCTPNEAQSVPLTEYHICTKKLGLVGLSLENILKRRQYFKTRRNIHPNYDRRQKVLKWLLVCCFGYQGYRNARFGKIEAHEIISAYGRHALTLTQQIAANYGLEVVAGIVDSVWLKNSNEEPISSELMQDLCHDIAKEVELPVEHAANYHWIIFLPRRYEPEIGVLNRYYGLKTDGTFKLRGIEIRQSSSPPFIKNFQLNILKLLARARSWEQFRTQVIRAKQTMNAYIEQLIVGDIPLDELIIKVRVSRTPDAYKNNSRQAIAAKQLNESGVVVKPGMKIHYLITDNQAKDPTKRVKIKQLLRGDEKFDIEEYRKLIVRAYENLIPPEFERRAPKLEAFLNF
ncbi:MAG: DNA polymerase domain-containing protein [Promethearchaeota archaeon]